MLSVGNLFYKNLKSKLYNRENPILFPFFQYNDPYNFWIICIGDERLFDMENLDFVRVDDKHILYCKEVNLYFETGKDSYLLYKPAGKTIADLRLNTGRHPPLFVESKDRKIIMINAQKDYNRALESEIKKGDIVKVREVLVRIVEDTLSEPRSGSLQLIPDTMNMLIGQYVDQPQNLRALASLSFKDYTTTIHSINVMALTVVYCFFIGCSMEDTLNIGLGALYHDIGKTQISTRILTAPRKLTDEEFEIMKSHTSKGYELIEDSNLDNECVMQAILEHHEKLDGSGYPRRKSDISNCGQIIGIIDCYEALTNESRPYRNAAKPLEALRIIKCDVEKGKFNRELFEKFAYSLI